MLAGAVEELLDARGVARGDDQRGAVVVGEQQCQVGRRSRGREGHRPDAEVLDALQPGCVPVGVGGQYHLRAAAQHLGADAFWIADDQRGR